MTQWVQVASLELAAGAQPGGGAAAREFYEGKGRNKVMAKAKEAVSSWAISWLQKWWLVHVNKGNNLEIGLKSLNSDVGIMYK